eukprot:854122-Pleurochrysis_carterae.AAC.1
MSTCEQKKEGVHSTANLACLHERARDVRRMLRAAAQLHDKLLCARIAKHKSILLLYGEARKGCLHDLHTASACAQMNEANLSRLVAAC